MNIDELEHGITSVKRKRNVYRSIDDRPALLQELTTWRKDAHAQDPYRMVRRVTWFCDDDRLKLLSKTHPSNIWSVQDIVDLLGETEEWGRECGSQVYAVITNFDKARVKKALNEWSRKKAKM